MNFFAFFLFRRVDFSLEVALWSFCAAPEASGLHISELTFATEALENVPEVPILWTLQKNLSPSRRNPQSCSIIRLQQLIHRLAQATERDEDGVIFHVTLQSAHI